MRKNNSEKGGRTRKRVLYQPAFVLTIMKSLRQGKIVRKRRFLWFIVLKTKRPKSRSKNFSAKNKHLDGGDLAKHCPHGLWQSPKY